MKDCFGCYPLRGVRTRHGKSASIDRRGFLKNSLLAGGSALLAGKKIAALESAAQLQVAGSVSPAEIAAARFPRTFSGARRPPLSR